VLIAGVFLALHYLGIAPLMKPGDQGPTLTYAFAGIGVALLIYALLIVKPRTPVRDPSQSVDQFWATPGNAAKVLRVWFTLEGAAMMSVIGYLITGAPLVAIVMIVAIGTYWWCGPRMFAKP
jgi:drug/metabolite transporter (DMT)-like permease